MKLPFLDLQPTYAASREAIDAALARVAASGWFILGRELEGFERQWAAYCGTAHAVGLGNGLDALHLGLKALGVGEGDEVIVPSNTYIATWLAQNYGLQSVGYYVVATSALTLAGLLSIHETKDHRIDTPMH